MAFGGLVLSKTGNFLFRNAPVTNAGLQLFTLFGVIEQDVPGSIKKIAGIGYKEIESAFSMKGGFYGLKPKEFASLLKDNGLSWQSHHVLGTPFKMPPGAKMPNGADGKPMTIPPKMRNLKDDARELIDEVAAGGVPYLVCANISHSTRDEIKQAVEILGKAGEACKKAGLTLCYHNHESEFKVVDGQVPYDVFLSQLDADTLKMELDLGWATYSGNDPVEIFKKNPGRFPLWHVKDIDKATGKPVEIGAGYIDYKRIFANASVAGMKHFFIEQDGAPKPFENIATSLANLNKIVA
ncbi:MAG: sugar phosphate isomerase/epimerase [Chitinophagaceae bacterium]|nr:sugar phosphate isomerase/epimerase [Chitinophagaceae bacterium]